VSTSRFAIHALDLLDKTDPGNVGSGFDIWYTQGSNEGFEKMKMKSNSLLFLRTSMTMGMIKMRKQPLVFRSSCHENQEKQFKREYHWANMQIGTV
jgi:hypothetical protein